MCVCVRERDACLGLSELCFLELFLSQKKIRLGLVLVIELKYEFEPSGFEHNHLDLPITAVL